MGHAKNDARDPVIDLHSEQSKINFIIGFKIKNSKSRICKLNGIQDNDINSIAMHWMQLLPIGSRLQ